MIIAGYVGF